MPKKLVLETISVRVLFFHDLPATTTRFAYLTHKGAMPIFHFFLTAVGALEVHWKSLSLSSGINEQEDVQGLTNQ